jgi:transposase-like protein
MARQRKTYSASFKARIALAALKGDSTANELAAQHQIHPTLISNWKKALLDGVESLFADGARPAKGAGQPDPAELFEQIGRLKMELEWLKKKLPER